MKECVESRIREPKISVIIPCYNAEKTISYALNSLVSQTFKEFEVVIVNDGSTDKSIEVVQRYMGILDVQLISQKNKGVSTARNVAIQNSKGRYIMFLDSDDEYHSECLSFLLNEIERNNVDIVTSRYKFSNSYDEKLEKINCNKKITDKQELYKIYNYKRVNKINFVNCIFKRDIIQNNGVLFSRDIRYGEDSLFLLEYLFYCNQVEITDAVLYKYMILENSASKARNYERIQIIEAFKRAKFLWDTDEVFDSEISQYAVDRAIWAQAKDFAIADKELFSKLQEDYDVKVAMINMAHNSDEKLVRISALVYCVSAKLFCLLIKLFAII